jgi:mevalonate kinase
MSGGKVEIAKGAGHVNGVNGTNGNGTYVNGNGTKAHREAAIRKQSSPMMPAFMVSAPGKVIMFGEHSVVHGKV